MEPIKILSDRLFDYKIPLGIGSLAISLISTTVASIALVIILKNPASLQWAKSLGNMTYYGVAGCYVGTLVFFVISTVLLCAKKSKQEHSENNQRSFETKLKEVYLPESQLESLSEDESEDVENLEDKCQKALDKGDKNLLETVCNNGYKLPPRLLHALALVNGLSQKQVEGLVDFILLKVPESLNELNEEGQAAIHWAMGCGNLHLVNALLKKGALIQADKNGNTLLHFLSNSHEDLQESTAISLIESVSPKYIKIDAVNHNGHSPIEVALLHGDFVVCKAFFQKKVILPKSALHKLCSAENLLLKTVESFIDFLMEQELSIDAIIDEMTPLQCAARFGNVSQVVALCKKKAKINIHNKEGNALHHTIIGYKIDSKPKTLIQAEYSLQNRVRIIKELRLAGIDVNHTNQQGKTPLELADSEIIRQALQ